MRVLAPTVPDPPLVECQRAIRLRGRVNCALAHVHLRRMPSHHARPAVPFDAIASRRLCTVRRIFVLTPKMMCEVADRSNRCVTSQRSLSQARFDDGPRLSELDSVEIWPSTVTWWLHRA